MTKHGIALHSRIDGVGNKVDAFEKGVQNMGSDIEAKLAIPVKDKIAGIEQKGSHLT